jgi:hypothetical protein
MSLRTVAFGEQKRMDEPAYDEVIHTARPEGLGVPKAHAESRSNLTNFLPSMKTLLITVTATLVCAGAFGQGKLSFDNGDFLHLIYFTTNTWKLAPADQTTTIDNSGFCGGTSLLAGSSLYTGLTLSGTPGTIMSLSGSPTFIAGLYGGTSSNSLSLQTTTTIDSLENGNPGGVVPVNVTCINLPAGSPAYFQVQVYDSRAANAMASWNAGYYAGVSQIFQATPSTNYASIYQTTSPVNSTWAPGTFEPVDLAPCGAGIYGAIEVNLGGSGGGSLRVGFGPMEVIYAGAVWMVDGRGGYSSGVIVSGLAPGSHTVSFSSVGGWITPASQDVTITNGQTTTTVGWYYREPSRLQVIINPPEAVAAGAQWTLYPGDIWYSSGTTISLPAGNYQVGFSYYIAGWTPPMPRGVTLTLGSTVTLTGTYVAPPINVTAMQMQADGTFRFAFANAHGRSYSAYGTTNPLLPFSNWTFLGAITDSPPGQFQFIDTQATNTTQRYYRVSSP